MAGYEAAQRALDLMKGYGSPVTPRSFELWLAFVDGLNPDMNAAMKHLARERGQVGPSEVEALHAAHLKPDLVARRTETVSAAVAAEIAQVVETIDLAVGSTSLYTESLDTLTVDLAGSVDRSGLRNVLERLLLATQEVSASNRALETRLRDSRQEIENLREALESVRVEAMTDPLTGMANRKHFEEMLVKAVDHAEIERSPLALIVIDIDHFKGFNDTFGHLTGDQVLRLVSTAMREQVKRKATLARFGGEEFALILPDTLPEVARASAERIRDSVMRRELIKRSTGECLGRVTISLGVASHRDGDTAASLLDRADQCMFAAKRAGRNRTVTDADPECGLPTAA